MPRPNLFIVGTLKSGTTAMRDYLHRHPCIYMVGDPEPHFFGADLQFSQRQYASLDEYLELFRETQQFPFRGEKSTWYLYSTVAAQEIYSFAPNARIIIMLRNPVGMTYSLHRHNLFYGFETEKSFERALALEPMRKRGRQIPRGNLLIDHLFYSDVASYAEQVERYLDVFPRDHVHVIVYDDFVRDAEGEYRKAVEFLGLNPTGQQFEASVVNPGKEHKSALLARLFAYRPPSVQRLVCLIPERLRNVVGSAIVKANTRVTRRSPMAEGTRIMLEDKFRADVDRLSNLLGRDFSFWFPTKFRGSSQNPSDDRT